MEEFPGDISLRKRVGVIGGNSPGPDSMRAAEKMGELIAESGYVLVNGGMGGIMEASAKGAKKLGGFVVSILPGDSPSSGNSYSDMAIVTGLGYIRNPLVVLNSDILVAIDGSYGTLSEIAYAKIYHKKVLGLKTWDIEGVEECSDPGEVINKIRNYFGAA